MTQNNSSFVENSGLGNGDWQAQKEEFIETKIVNILQKYGGGTVLVIGVVGNAAALVILVRKRFRSNVFNCYLIAFTTADIVFIAFDQGLGHWNEVISDFVLKNYSDFTCKMWTYITRMSYTYSNWALVGINLNRAVAIIFPLKMRLLTNRTNNYLYLFISLIVIAVFEVYEIISYEIVENSYYGQTSKGCAYVANPSPSLRYFNDKVIGWLYFVTSTLVPGIIILFCNTFMIITLLRRNKRRSQMVSRTNSTDSRTINIALTLVTVSTAFVVLQAPMFYISLRFLLRGTYEAWYDRSPRNMAIAKLEWEASVFLLVLNHSINFILYLIGGHEFRQEFAEVFCGICKNKCLNNRDSSGSIELPNASAEGNDPKPMKPQTSLPTVSTAYTGSNPSVPSIE